MRFRTSGCGGGVKFGGGEVRAYVGMLLNSGESSGKLGYIWINPLALITMLPDSNWSSPYIMALYWGRFCY